MKSEKILLITIAAFMVAAFTGGYYYIANRYFADQDPLILLLIYILFVYILITPFVRPLKKDKKLFADEVIERYKVTVHERKKTPRRKINLDVEFKAPLTMKCVCGMLLTRYMKKCPACGRPNPFYGVR